MDVGIHFTHDEANYYHVQFVNTYAHASRTVCPLSWQRLLLLPNQVQGIKTSGHIKIFYGSKKLN